MMDLSLHERLIEPLAREETSRDVKFVCADRSLRFHQSVLALHSPLLKAMLAERAWQTEAVVTLDWLESPVLAALMEYLYTGTCQVKGGRDMLVQMTELKNILAVEAELNYSVATSDKAECEGREAQKRITLAIMASIESLNSGVSKLQCCQCDQDLTRDTFMLHYRSHMQQLAGQQGREQQQPPDRLGSPARQTKASSACKKPRQDLTVTSAETAAKASRLVKQEKPSSESGTDIDMAEYEKLLRSHHHGVILGRKRKAARSALQPAGLVLVSQQEIDEEILRNPKADKAEDYAVLKIRSIHKRLAERKRKMRKSSDPNCKEVSVVQDEEIQQEIDRENESRSVKLRIDVKRIRSRRTKAIATDEEA